MKPQASSASARILNVDLTDSMAASSRNWFSKTTVQAMKSTAADIITIQSLLSSTSSQDLNFLFGPQFDHTKSRRNKGCPATTAVLWRRDRFHAKIVNLETLTGGNTSSFMGDSSSICMVHLWSTQPDVSSLTIVSWTACPMQENGLSNTDKIKLLEGLLRFMTLFRRTSNIKMRFVLCGHYGFDLRGFNFRQYPYFKQFNIVKPTHVKSLIFISPFIYTEDTLRVIEASAPNVFPLMSNRNIKMVKVTGNTNDENYDLPEKASIYTATNFALTEKYMRKMSLMPPPANTEVSDAPGSMEEAIVAREKQRSAARTIQKAMAWNHANRKREEAMKKEVDKSEAPDAQKRLQILDRVVSAFHFAALSKHVREEKAFQKAIERNKMRDTDKATKKNKGGDNNYTFPKYKPGQKIVSRSSTLSDLVSGPRLAYSENGKSKSVDKAIYDLPPIDDKRAQREEVMHLHTVNLLSPRPAPYSSSSSSSSLLSSDNVSVRSSRRPPASPQRTLHALYSSVPSEIRNKKVTMDMASRSSHTLTPLYLETAAEKFLQTKKSPVRNKATLDALYREAPDKFLQTKSRAASNSSSNGTLVTLYNVTPPGSRRATPAVSNGDTPSKGELGFRRLVNDLLPHGKS